MAEEPKMATEATTSPVMASSRRPSRSDQLKRQFGRIKRQKVMVLSLVFGLLGGAVGSYAFVTFGSGVVPVAKKQIVVQESSAVIDVAKKVSPSVVSITSQSVSRGFFGQPVQQDSAGTGIVLTADGLILTNKHVASDLNATYTVITSDGKELKNAKVVAQDTVNDIAFLRVSASGLTPAKLGDSSKIQVGQRVVAIGNALGEFQNTVT
jgi:S1-C subfamily serine protease